MLAGGKAPGCISPSQYGSHPMGLKELGDVLAHPPSVTFEILWRNLELKILKKREEAKN